jgi:hypothetical protein
MTFYGSRYARARRPLSAARDARMQRVREKKNHIRRHLTPALGRHRLEAL